MQIPAVRTAPCHTFAGAISKTAAGGEIDALDPGGFGALTITKSITLDGGGEQVAGVLVAGTNGLVIQAAPSDVVIIRNLTITGVGQGLSGIRFLQGALLVVDNVHINNFTQHGIEMAVASNSPTTSGLVVRNSTITQIAASGVKITSGPVSASLDNVSIGAPPPESTQSRERSRSTTASWCETPATGCWPRAAPSISVTAC
jgi:Right handed beta helix region